MGTYVVGDIHGCFDEWSKFKNNILKQDPKARFIFVGDVIDRGLESKKMFWWCLFHVRPFGRYRMVIGNHEYEKISRENNLFKRLFFKSLPYYIDMRINDRRFIIVHAELPQSIVKKDYTLRRKRKLSKEEKQQMVWSRKVASFDAIPDVTIIHGHTPTLFTEAFAEGDYSFERLGRIYRLGNVINVDCGIGYLQRRFRRLAAIRLDDMKEFYYPD